MSSGLGSAFDLFLFSTDADFIRAAVDAGVDGVVVDWEQRGKEARQALADTQINYDTPDDLVRVRRATSARVLCRINGICDTTTDEIDTAIALGADEILLPMVRTASQVQDVLDRVAGRCKLGILIETASAVECAGTFAHLPLTRVYLGLNDLAIEQQRSNLFGAVGDGTVERVRRLVRVPFGFGGLTVPEGGRPIPCRLLMGEMRRLGCRFSFLRRSFHRDARGQRLPEVVARIRRGLAQASCRTEADVQRDRVLLTEAIDGWNVSRAAG